MRAIALMMVVVLTAATPAAASWKEYPQPQLGFVVEFPSDPASSTGNYKTTLVASATVHIYSVKDDQSVFMATVVDLLDRKEEGATLLGEAESMVRQLGDVTSVSAAPRCSEDSSRSCAEVRMYRIYSARRRKAFAPGSRTSREPNARMEAGLWRICSSIEGGYTSFRG